MSVFSPFHGHRVSSFALCSLLASPLACSGASSLTDGGPSPRASSSGSDVPAANFAGLVINEVAPAGDPTDWFELKNTSSKTLSLDDLAFTDDVVGAPLKARLPLGVTLAPGAYFTLDVTDELQGFKLGGDEELGLYTSSGELIDSVDWAEGAAPAGQSLGRIPDGTGPFVTLTEPTRGEENVAPLEEPADAGPGAPDEVLEEESALDGGMTADAGEGATEIDVVINEVTSAGDDAIELYNLGEQDVDLGGWRVADSAYDPAVESTVAAQSLVLPA
ncbi:MAG: lamin tail domain-containing protein, partial [Myxococcota bacterium]